MITKLFIHIFLVIIKTEVPFRTRNFRGIHLTKNGFSGPRSFQGFEKQVPGLNTRISIHINLQKSTFKIIRKGLFDEI